MLDGYGAAGGAEQVVPAHRQASLDGDAGCNRGGQNRLAVLCVLLSEPLTRRHGNHAGGDALLCEGCASLNSELNLGTGSDQDDVRGALGVSHDVAAACGALSGGELLTLSVCVHVFTSPDRQVLTGEHDTCGAVGLLQDGAPCDGGFVSVRGANHVEAGDSAQRGEVLDRLVGGAVLAHTDGVVGPHVQCGNAHQRGEANSRALVVGEHEEGARERAGRGGEHDAVDDCCGSLLANTEVQHATVGVAGPVFGAARCRVEGLCTLDGG